MRGTEYKSTAKTSQITNFNVGYCFIYTKHVASILKWLFLTYTAKVGKVKQYFSSPTRCCLPLIEPLTFTRISAAFFIKDNICAKKKTMEVGFGVEGVGLVYHMTLLIVYIQRAYFVLANVIKNLEKRVKMSEQAEKNPWHEAISLLFVELNKENIKLFQELRLAITEMHALQLELHTKLIALQMALTKKGINVITETRDIYEELNAKQHH